MARVVHAFRSASLKAAVSSSESIATAIGSSAHSGSGVPARHVRLRMKAASGDPPVLPEESF